MLRPILLELAEELFHVLHLVQLVIFLQSPSLPLAASFTGSRGFGGRIGFFGIGQDFLLAKERRSRSCG